MARRRTVPRERLVAAGALGALLLGLWLAVARGLEEDTTAPEAAPTITEAAPTTPTTPTRAKPGPAPFVRLAAAGAYDPEGDGRERDEEAGLAVDGRRDTAWRTEQYSSFFKDGVGLVLDAGRRIRVERVVVDVPAPGARAAILLGNERDGPFTTVAPARPLSGRTRFAVAGRPGRYVMIWIVDVPDGNAAEIAEVRVRARG
jgi:hypothetical protein